MNLQQLEYFICVADMFNYTAAAKKLNITQSALSQSIAKLEAELNTSLFYKEGRNIKMTADAESFYVHAKTALESVNFGINNMHSKNNTLLQPIVLLCSIGISSIFLSELVKEWLNVKPFVP